MKSNNISALSCSKLSAAEITHALKELGHDMADGLKNLQCESRKNGIEIGRELERRQIKHNMIEASTYAMGCVVIGLTLAKFANYFINKRGDNHEHL